MFQPVSSRASNPAEGVRLVPAGVDVALTASQDSLSEGGFVPPIHAAMSDRDIGKEVCALFVDIADTLGFPRSYGEIYGLLYISACPLSFTDIQGRLQLSSGSVSQGLRALRDIGAIRLQPDKGGRRDHFVAETELRALAAVFLREIIQPQLKKGAIKIAELRRANTALGGSKTVEGRLLQGRLKKLETWHRKGSTLLPLLSRFLG
jgi:DNA-binding transcriptional regulator GbsR (MarR family)